MKMSSLSKYKTVCSYYGFGSYNWLCVTRIILFIDCFLKLTFNVIICQNVKRCVKIFQVYKVTMVGSGLNS
jgi:hypothetical protein